MAHAERQTSCDHPAWHLDHNGDEDQVAALNPRRSWS
jgi:hypothetical protein